MQLSVFPSIDDDDVCEKGVAKIMGGVLLLKAVAVIDGIIKHVYITLLMKQRQYEKRVIFLQFMKMLQKLCDSGRLGAWKLFTEKCYNEAHKECESL